MRTTRPAIRAPGCAPLLAGTVTPGLRVQVWTLQYRVVVFAHNVVLAQIPHVSGTRVQTNQPSTAIVIDARIQSTIVATEILQTFRSVLAR